MGVGARLYAERKEAMKTIKLFIAIIVALSASASHAAETLVWRSKSGHETRASLSGFELVLVKESGQVIRISLQALSLASQEQALIPEFARVQMMRAKANISPPGPAAPPQAAPLPAAEVMSAKEFREVLLAMEKLKLKPAGRGVSKAKQQYLWEKTKERWVKKYGQFRVRLVFPVVDVRGSIRPGEESSTFALRLGACSGAVSGYLDAGGVLQNPTNYVKYGYAARIRLTREEMLSIGPGTHRYEMVFPVTFAGGSKVFYPSFFNLYYAAPIDPAECRLVSERKGKKR